MPIIGTELGSLEVGGNAATAPRTDRDRPYGVKKGLLLTDGRRCAIANTNTMRLFPSNPGRSSRQLLGEEGGRQ